MQSRRNTADQLVTWYQLFNLDFVEGPVPIEPIDLTLESARARSRHRSVLAPNSSRQQSKSMRLHRARDTRSHRPGRAKKKRRQEAALQVHAEREGTQLHA